MNREPCCEQNGRGAHCDCSPCGRCLETGNVKFFQPRKPRMLLDAFTWLGIAAIVAVAAFVLATLPGCASFSDAKPVIRSVVDIAVEACETYFGQHPEATSGLPIGELCKVGSDVLGPFLDQTTVAVSTAGPQAAELASRRKP